MSETVDFVTQFTWQCVAEGGRRWELGINDVGRMTHVVASVTRNARGTWDLWIAGEGSCGWEVTRNHAIELVERRLAGRFDRRFANTLRFEKTIQAECELLAGMRT